jgi:diguanylate cyclase (GGDEF)-like protein
MTTQDDPLHRLLALDHRGLDVLRETAAVLGELQQTLRDLAQRNQQLEMLATTDHLTGLMNRRGFEEELAREEARARRERTSAAVVAVDVRRLKSVNEAFGHGAGDDLLRAIGHAFRAAARRSDVVARIGGDEFAALLPGANRAGAEVFVERVRGGVGRILLPTGEVIGVQLAAGVAVREEVESLHEALQLADGRLLLDKQRPRA